MDRELPTINSHTLSCSNYSGVSVDHLYRSPFDTAGNQYQPQDYSSVKIDDDFLRKRTILTANSIPTKSIPTKKETPMPEAKYRVVRIFIVDTDDNIPLDKSLIFTGEEKFTDATDQELFFDVDIKKILTDHNAYRAGVLDKKQTNKLGKEIFLEPIKIRDLTMTVVNVATF